MSRYYKALKLAHYFPPTVRVICGAAEATGLGFVSFVVISPRVANRVDFLGGFCFIKFSILLSPPPQHVSSDTPPPPSSVDYHLGRVTALMLTGKVAEVGVVMLCVCVFKEEREILRGNVRYCGVCSLVCFPA